MTPSLGSYLGGSIWMLVAAGALLSGGYWLRRLIVPRFSGALAWLAQLVLSLSLLVPTLELIGSFGLLSQGWIVGASLAVGAGATLIGWSKRPHDIRQAAPPRVPTWALLIAGAVAAVVVVEWSFPTLLNLRQGIFSGDGTWYHLPFAARFAQSHSTWGLHFTDPLRLAPWFYPAGSELLGSLGILFFHSDWLSPLMNLAWLGFGMLAAYCVGRPYGVGPATLIAAALVLGSGVMLQTQAGDARNDTMGMALLLALAALLVNCRSQDTEPDAGRRGFRIDRGALIVAGLAAGLAASVKFTMLAPVGAIVVLAIVLAGRGRRLQTAGILAATVTLTGGYWYLRNLAHSGNPIPQIYRIGPIALPHPNQMQLYPREPHSVAHYLVGHPRVFRAWIFPQLHNAFGPLFPAILALGILAAAFAIAGSRDRLVAILGAAALVAAIVYIFLPLSAAGPPGELHGFFTNTRYLAPAIVLALVTVPVLGPLRWNPVVTASTLFMLTLLCVVSTLAPAQWYSRFTTGAVLIALALVGVPIAAAMLAELGGRFRLLAPLLMIAVVGAAVAVGHGHEVTYSRIHYTKRILAKRAAGSPINTFSWARRLHNRRIGVAGSGELFFAQYLLYGADSSNWVQYIGQPGPHGQYRVAPDCRALRTQIDRGNYDYLVLSQWGDDAPDRTAFPIRAWVKNDPALTQISREEVSPQTVWVYRVHGRLDPAACGKRQVKPRAAG